MVEVKQRRPIAWIREGQCFRCTSHTQGSNGYPKLKRNKKTRNIARMILIRRLGDIPTGVVSRHTCDNRWCIRPDHIISGSQSDNMKDRKERGGYGDQRGEKNPCHKLTYRQVSQIREATGFQREIAKRFGVTQSHVSLIKRFKTRRDL